MRTEAARKRDRTTLITDAIIETHDRITGKLYRECEKARQVQIDQQKDTVANTLRAFANIGSSMIAENESCGDLNSVIVKSCGWEGLENLVIQANSLTYKYTADILDFVAMGYKRFRRYVPRMLELISLQGKVVARSLIYAVEQLKALNKKDKGNFELIFDFSFARPKWQSNPQAKAENNRKYWELAILFALRDNFRSHDIWLPHSRKRRALTDNLIATSEVEKCGKLAVPLNASEWLESRKTVLHNLLEEVGQKAKIGQLPNGVIKDGQFRLERLGANTPTGADDLVLELYGKIPSHKITDILQEVSQNTGFTEAFTNLRTGAPCKDNLGLLNVILADGVNLGLKKMAASTNTHSFWQLLRIAQWHMHDEAFNQALATIIEAQSKLPMAQFWGNGTTSSSDGQFFSSGGAGEAMNVINAKYGNTPGLKAYTHVSDQFGVYSIQNIPATASEAPYVLDGLVLNQAGNGIKEHYTDTGGFTDHVFAMCSILGYRFAPRIKDLSHKRLYAFDLKSVHKSIRPLISNKIREGYIERNWPEILRISASAAVGKIAPSQILKKLSSYSQQKALLQIAI